MDRREIGRQNKLCYGGLIMNKNKFEDEFSPLRHDDNSLEKEAGYAVVNTPNTLKEIQPNPYVLDNAQRPTVSSEVVDYMPMDKTPKSTEKNIDNIQEDDNVM